MIDKLRMGPACYHTFHVFPPMVAHEMNFFVDEGLVDRTGRPAYEIVPGGISPFNAEKASLAQAMKEKGIHIAMDVKPSTVVYLNRRGAKLRIICGWRNQQPTWIIGARDVPTLADARGRVVGLLDFGSIRYDALAFRLKEIGLDPQRDVRYVRGVRDAPGMLEAGEIDVAFVKPQRAHGLIENGFHKLLDMKDFYPEGRPDRIIVATDDLLNDRPDWVDAFIKGIIRSYWFIRTMPENLTYLQNLEKRMHLQSTDNEEFHSPSHSFSTPLDCELLPFPIDGMPTGFDSYLREQVELGHIEQEDVDTLKESLRTELIRESFSDLSRQSERQPELDRVQHVAERVGY